MTYWKVLTTQSANLKIWVKDVKIIWHIWLPLLALIITSCCYFQVQLCSNSFYIFNKVSCMPEAELLHPDFFCIYVLKSGAATEVIPNPKLFCPVMLFQLKTTHKHSVSMGRHYKVRLQGQQKLQIYWVNFAESPQVHCSQLMNSCCFASDGCG